ncbi:MAG: AbrB/MazE/SpoVT family DNA-binding domain-containing protein [Candidatus Methanogranum gryphiswaldense]|nr:MAG: AbrB/MazE/SpoVT family DNA-binding domain-containing protein [Candidatus Methanogranum sp. U3.2.1]
MLGVEIRKIQITGGSSYMVTLPKEWAESVNLKKNDPVRLEVQPDGSLLISTKEPTEKASSIKNILAHEDSILLYRQLIGAYISGHKEIRVYSESRLSGAVTETVSRFTQTSIGLEIVEEDDDHILMRDLMNHSEMRPQKSIERMRVLVNNMLNDVYSSAGNASVLMNMDQRDTEVDRIHWLISRQVSIYLKDPWLCKKMDVRPYDVSRCLTASRMMERIGDHIVIISKNLIRLESDGKGTDVDKGIKEIGTDMTKLFTASMNSWLKKDMMLAENCIEVSNKTVDKIKKTFKKIEIDTDTASPTNTIAASTRRIAEYCADIAEQTINAAME